MYSENLKKYRDEAKLSQKELSEKSGVSRAMINELENGKLKTVTAETLKKLAAALNRSVSEIFDGV